MEWYVDKVPQHSGWYTSIGAIAYSKFMREVSVRWNDKQIR